MSTIQNTPRQDTIIDNIWTYAEILARLPRFFEAVNSEPDVSNIPASERFYAKAMLACMAVTAAAASPVVYATATVATAGEKLWSKIDILPELAEKVQAFGDGLSQQEQLIEEFRPILDLTTKVSIVSNQVEKRAEAVEASAQTLEELRENYAEHVPVLEQVQRFISKLTPAVSNRLTPGSLKEQLFRGRVEMLTQISEEQQKLRALQQRLKGVVSRVQDKAAILQKLEEDATILTRAKEGQIRGLQEQVDALPENLTSRTNHVVLESQPVV